MFPSNEAETIALYKLCQHRLGWKIVHLQTAFPDAIIENEDGQQLIAEFEYKAKNFRAHGHDPMGCDLIIAYHNGWKNPPVPVWALEDYTHEEVSIIRKIIGYPISLGKYLEVCGQCSRLEDNIRDLKAQLKEPEQVAAPIPQNPTSSSPDWLTTFAFFGLGVGVCAGLPTIMRFLGVV